MDVRFIKCLRLFFQDTASITQNKEFVYAENGKIYEEMCKEWNESKAPSDEGAVAEGD
jgi:hypothetical protein